MNIRLILAAAAATMLAGCSSLKDGEYNLSLVTTGDGHGSWFSKPFSEKGSARSSLMAQSQYINELRSEKGAEATPRSTMIMPIHCPRTFTRASQHI